MVQQADTKKGAMALGANCGSIVVFTEAITMGLAHSAKVLVTGTPTILTGGKPGARAGDEGLAFANPNLQGPEKIEIHADAFKDNQPIPVLHSADGGSVSPALHWSAAPVGTQSWAMIVEDPDAPLPKPFVHWLLYNIPPSTTSLPAAVGTEAQLSNPPMLQGKNSAMKVGYAGCAPPRGDTPHRYFFQIFALEKTLNIGAGVGRSELLGAMEGHVLARGKVIGTYEQ
jgi:Raf kinase inhibitor-like YbhB/YbcL family protein